MTSAMGCRLGSAYVPLKEYRIVQYAYYVQAGAHSRVLGSWCKVYCPFLQDCPIEHTPIQTLMTIG